MSSNEPRRMLGRQHGPLHWTGVVIGLAGGFVLGVLLLGLSGSHHAGYQQIALLVLTTVEVGLFAYLSVPILVRWYRALDLFLKTTPLPNLITGVLGMIIGLILAALASIFLREFPFGGALSAALAALLAFL